MAQSSSDAAFRPASVGSPSATSPSMTSADAMRKKIGGVRLTIGSPKSMSSPSAAAGWKLQNDPREQLEFEIKELEAKKRALQKEVGRLEQVQKLHSSVNGRSLRTPSVSRSASMEVSIHQVLSKFDADPNVFEYNYANEEDFYGGLEAFIGSPSPDIFIGMEREHRSDDKFDSVHVMQTTPRLEWQYVVESEVGEEANNTLRQAGAESKFNRDSTGGEGSVNFGEHDGWQLLHFTLDKKALTAGLIREEVIALRLYTGPMYVHYNGVLRKQSERKPRFVTTIHAANSAINKLSQQTKACTVYRGMVGGKLPDDFHPKDDEAVRGAVERAFMSTSKTREVALSFAREDPEHGGEARILFEIEMGMVAKGADVSFLSQFPEEEEILFAPLTALEVIRDDRVRVEKINRLDAQAQEEEVELLVYRLRLANNMQDEKLEKVVGKMKNSHLALLGRTLPQQLALIRDCPPFVSPTLSSLRALASCCHAQS